MADGDDLPDGEFESIYGREALHARLLARLDAILKRQDARLAQLKARRDDDQPHPPRPS